VTSNDNPADALSRGCTPSELKYNSQWWYGPSWLESKTFKCSTSYTKNTEHISDVQSEEKTALMVVCTSQRDVSLDINKYSSLNKLSHVVAYLLRYKKNSLSKRNNSPRIIGPLNVDEISTAIKSILKLLQGKYFFFGN